jgi:telomere length regulation protein
VIEQYFSQQYSVSQRFAMLSALAMGARELAGLPTLTAPPARINDDQNLAGNPRAIDTDFPTQRLPPKLHKYFMQAQGEGSEEGSPAGGPSTPQLDAMTEDITNLALSSARREAEQAVPGAKREKLLTVRSTTTKRSKIVEQDGSSMNGVGNGAHSRLAAPKFADLAVETFIMPLINRFWLYLRDVSTSPQLATVGPYAGGRAGAAPLLDPLLLSKYLSTLCVLLDAARNSPHFLAVLAPETLELVLALRSGAEVDGTPARRGGVNADAVQTALLQLSLVVLETSTSIDSGRTLARDFPKITWRVKDWAEEVWRGKESGGGEVDAGGRAAAGVLLRLDEVVSRTIGYH